MISELKTFINRAVTFNRLISGVRLRILKVVQCLVHLSRAESTVHCVHRAFLSAASVVLVVVPLSNVMATGIF